MKDLKTSIVESLDGTSNPELFPFLDYLLQDLTEIGTEPRLVEKLIRTHIQARPLRVLDLGCGKGAVSIHLARVLGCQVTGIDGMEAFIQAAQKLAASHQVAHLCNFIQGDIREKVKELNGFDVVILGAIGPVFGFMGDTLKAVLPTLNKGGFVIIDDGFKEDNTLPAYDKVLGKTDFYTQIAENGFSILEEIILSAEDIASPNQSTQQCIVTRAKELVQKVPDRAELFNNYVQAQENEIDVMENRLTVGIWLLKML